MSFLRRINAKLQSKLWLVGCILSRHPTVTTLLGYTHETPHWVFLEHCQCGKIMKSERRYSPDGV